MRVGLLAVTNKTGLEKLLSEAGHEVLPFTGEHDVRSLRAGDCDAVVTYWGNFLPDLRAVGIPVCKLVSGMVVPDEWTELTLLDKFTDDLLAWLENVDART